MRSCVNSTVDYYTSSLTNSMCAFTLACILCYALQSIYAIHSTLDSVAMWRCHLIHYIKVNNIRYMGISNSKASSLKYGVFDVLFEKKSQFFLMKKETWLYHVTQIQYDVHNFQTIFGNNKTSTSNFQLSTVEYLACQTIFSSISWFQCSFLASDIFAAIIFINPRQWSYILFLIRE